MHAAANCSRFRAMRFLMFWFSGPKWNFASWKTKFFSACETAETIRPARWEAKQFGELIRNAFPLPNSSNGRFHGWLHIQGERNSNLSLRDNDDDEKAEAVEVFSYLDSRIAHRFGVDSHQKGSGVRMTCLFCALITREILIFACKQSYRTFASETCLHFLLV